MQPWYAVLEKPFFAPPAWLFGPVWSALYLIIAISFGYVLYHIIKKQIPYKVGLPFVVNLVLNFSFTPVMFGLQNLVLASVVVVCTALSIIWMMYAIAPYSRAVMYAQVPYLLWVSFASVLQLTITVLNV